MTSNTKHLMIDIEAAGKSTSAALLSIGAVFFDPAMGKLGETFYQPIKLASSQYHGGQIDASTVEWWIKQSEEARSVFNAENRVSLKDALNGLAAFIKTTAGEADVYVWGNGPAYDNAILANAFHATWVKQPWAFSKDTCVRTMVMLGRQLGIDPKYDMTQEGEHHNALDDAIHQARYVSVIWQALMAPLLPSVMSAAQKQEEATLKAKAVMEFVNNNIGAFEAGFIDQNYCTLQQLYRSAQHHVKDNYGIETPLMFDLWGKELFEECKEPNINVEWHSPEKVPDVEKGTEKKFWIAVRSADRDQPHVFSAYYQNRPLELDEDGEPIDDNYLVDPNEDPFHSVGWVSEVEHEEFENFYTNIDFHDGYRLLGWADYKAPIFTNSFAVDESCNECHGSGSVCNDSGLTDEEETCEACQGSGAMKGSKAYEEHCYGNR